MVEHKGIINYIFNIKDYVSISSEDKVDFSSNIGFDLTVTTTLCSLCLGAQVVVYGHQLQDLETYKKHLVDNNINVIKMVPSYFELLIDSLPVTKINKVVLGGEKLRRNIINKLEEICGANNNDIDLVIYDEYGPTEATVGTCNHQVYPGAHLTIGKPYNNYKVYVVDSNLTPLPIGAIGELYIGGAGLARGYLNRSELTEERFIPNPFQTPEEKLQNKNARLYKTGDLVRWLADGNLEYIGRNDFQIKISGHRIELGEIEATLLKHGDVSQAAVIASNEDIHGNKRLIAYIVPGEFTPFATELMEFLAERLPEYMIPSVIINLEKLPLTINGKVDRRALPDPEFKDVDTYVMPRNELERELCQIWAEVLGLPENKVGIQDDFFKLGGNSILAIKLVSKLNKNLNSSINVYNIFTSNTVDKLNCYLQYNNKNNEKGKEYVF
jgi:acyl-coenzyme A synthetase/AMP-(fatty) acid ligase